jgi:hypothetical protein
MLSQANGYRPAVVTGKRLRLFLRTSEEMDDNNEDDGANRCRSKRIEEAARASADFEFAENPAAEDRTDESEKNVRETAVATAARDFSREPTCDEAEKNPTGEAAINGDAKDLIYVSHD